VIDFNADDATPTNTGQAILAIDVAAFDDFQAFTKRIDALSRDIRGSQRMKGYERIFLPGEQSHARHEERSRLGVPVAPALLSSLNQLGEKLGIGRLA
jgi:LDH2 family malate/lactate/ureidoglycolate dehydrogenase